MSTYRSLDARPTSGVLLTLAALLWAARAEAGPCEAFRFAPPRDVVSIPAQGVVHVADLTGDGRADLLVRDYRGPTVQGAVQRPDGTFEALKPLDTTAFDLLTADVDGDGVTEGVLLREDGPQVIRVRDDGTIEAGPVATWSGTLRNTMPRAISDLDRDGRSEILVNTGSALLAFRAGANGAFHADVAAALSLGAAAGLSLVVGDFDGDENADVVATAENYPTHSPGGPVLWGDGRGGLAPGQALWLPEIADAAVADFDGNGREDFVYVASVTTATSHHWLSGLVASDGAGGMTARNLSLISSPAVLASADFDRDGRPDLVLSYNSSSLYRGTGSEFVQVDRIFGFTAYTAADVDGDGFPDLVGSGENGVPVARNVCGTTLADASVPVVVSVTGANGVRFETEMTIDGLGAEPVDLDVAYVPSFGGGAGSATFHLDASGQLFFPSVLAALAEAGIPLPPEGERGGSLAIRVRGGTARDIAVTTRVIALGAGRGGVSFSERSLGSGLCASAVVGWLRETGGDRSNLALVNLGDEKEGAARLRVTLVSDEPGARRVVLPEVSLEPGAHHQWNRVLALGRMTGGWALVERVSGGAPFFAYGVVNDEGTG